jgi:hypothetical protein
LQDLSALPEEGRRGARKAAEELRRSAQEGTANPLRTRDSEEHGTPPSPPTRADSRAIVSSMPLEAPMVQRNVVRRIVLFVKNTLFRQIKFVISTKSFNEAFQKLLVEERPRNLYIFQLTSQNSFKTALNQKQSTCELSGKKIVIKAINTVFKNREEEFFTFDEFCKLRRATTDRERKAFFWFFDSFLECVCGASIWNEDEPKRMEKLLLDFCRTKAGIKDPQDDENLDGAGDGPHNNAAARAKANKPVEADWDSDDE